MLRKWTADGKVLLTWFLTQDFFSPRRKVAADFQENSCVILGKGILKKNGNLIVSMDLGL